MTWIFLPIKVTAILSRLEIKDYVDLYFLLTEKAFDIFDLMKKARQKAGWIF
jgi:hypothetical protein